MTKSHNPVDKQTPHTGKVENDHNKLGNQKPTQRNEPKRTPQSRSDREVFAGSHNVVKARRDPPGNGKG